MYIQKSCLFLCFQGTAVTHLVAFCVCSVSTGRNVFLIIGCSTRATEILTCNSGDLSYSLNYPAFELLMTFIILSDYRSTRQFYVLNL